MPSLSGSSHGSSQIHRKCHSVPETVWSTALFVKWTLMRHFSAQGVPGAILRAPEAQNALPEHLLSEAPPKYIENVILAPKRFGRQLSS